MIDVVTRTFTKAEAQELVPVLTELFTEARSIVEELLARRHDAALASIDGAVVVDDDSAFRMRQLRELLQVKLQSVTELGLEVRRVDGLVDIPAWFDGEQGYFCWRYGDEVIGHWHRAHEGCTERRPVNIALAIGLH